MLRVFVTGCLDPKVRDASYSHMDATQSWRECTKGVLVLSAMQGGCSKGVSKHALSLGRLEINSPK